METVGFSRKEQTETEQCLQKGPKKDVDYSFPHTSYYSVHPKSVPRSPVSSHTLLYPCSQPPLSCLHYHSSLPTGLTDSPRSVENTAARVIRSCHSCAPKPAMAAHFTSRSQAHTTTWDAPPNLEPSPPPTLLTHMVFQTTTSGLWAGCCLCRNISSHGHLYSKVLYLF